MNQLHAQPETAHEAEDALLGCMMHDHTIVPDVSVRVPAPTCFGSTQNMLVYEAVLAVHRKYGACDLPTVISNLRETNRLEDAGGVARLTSIREAQWSSVGWTVYANDVIESHRRRVVVQSCQEALHATLNTAVPLEQTISNLAAGLASASTVGASLSNIKLGDAARMVAAEIDAGRAAMYRTGIGPLDLLSGGIPQDGITTVLGVPGSGKSSLAAQIALNIAKDSVPVLFFSFEVGAQQSTANLLGVESETPVNRMLMTGQGFVDMTSRLAFDRAVQEFGALPFEFVEDLLTAEQISDRVSLAATKGVRCVVVDYVQGIAGHPKEKESDIVARSCRVIQRMQVRHKLCVLMVSQLLADSTRKPEPPKASDGVGSGAIQQVSTMMIGVFRPCVFRGKETGESDPEWQARSREASLHIIKNKRGALGIAPVSFIGKYMKFANAGVA